MARIWARGAEGWEKGPLSLSHISATRQPPATGRIDRSEGLFNWQAGSRIALCDPIVCYIPERLRKGLRFVQGCCQTRETISPVDTRYAGRFATCQHSQPSNCFAHPFRSLPLFPASLFTLEIDYLIAFKQHTTRNSICQALNYSSI